MSKKKKVEDTSITEITKEGDIFKDFGDSIVGNLSLFDKESMTLLFQIKNVPAKRALREAKEVMKNKT